jgi:hypothetical protein
MSYENNTTGALSAIEELRVDSKIGKSKHFAASDRKLLWHRLCGVPVIVANLFVGIVLVSIQGTNTNPPPSASHEQVTTITTKKEDITKVAPSGPSENLSLLSIFLAFGAASLSGVQTFFNFHKASEGHRAIGNRYVHVSRQCKALQQKHCDIPFSAEDIWSEYLKLYNEYHQINTEAEAFPTSPSDLKKAKGAPEISPYKNPHALKT